MSPRNESRKILLARDAGDSRNATVRVVYFRYPRSENERSAARLRGLIIFRYSNLGFRCAPPQALCCRLLRRLVVFCSTDFRNTIPVPEGRNIYSQRVNKAFAAPEERNVADANRRSLHFAPPELWPLGYLRAYEYSAPLELTRLVADNSRLHGDD